AYHAALYRFVEPTSVTPFSVPARQRALHAALVVLARHARGWTANDDAGSFDRTDSRWRQLVEAFLRRVASADPDERAAVERHLRQLEDEWTDTANRAARRNGLRYRASGRQHLGLLRRFGENRPGWPT